MTAARPIVIKIPEIIQQIDTDIAGIHNALKEALAVKTISTQSKEKLMKFIGTVKLMRLATNKEPLLAKEKKETVSKRRGSKTLADHYADIVEHPETRELQASNLNDDKLAMLLKNTDDKTIQDILPYAFAALNILLAQKASLVELSNNEALKILSTLPNRFTYSPLTAEEKNLLTEFNEIESKYPKKEQHVQYVTEHELLKIIAEEKQQIQTFLQEVENFQLSAASLLPAYENYFTSKIAERKELASHFCQEQLAEVKQKAAEIERIHTQVQAVVAEVEMLSPSENLANLDRLAETLSAEVKYPACSEQVALLKRYADSIGILTLPPSTPLSENKVVAALESQQQTRRQAQTALEVSVQALADKINEFTRAEQVYNAYLDTTATVVSTQYNELNKHVIQQTKLAKLKTDIWYKKWDEFTKKLELAFAHFDKFRSDLSLQPNLADYFCFWDFQLSHTQLIQAMNENGGPKPTLKLANEKLAAKLNKINQELTQAIAERFTPLLETAKKEILTQLNNVRLFAVAQVEKLTAISAARQIALNKVQTLKQQIAAQQREQARQNRLQYFELEQLYRNRHRDPNRSLLSTPKVARSTAPSKKRGLFSIFADCNLCGEKEDPTAGYQELPKLHSM